MELVEVKFAVLHGPLFFAGRNFGEKLDPGRIGGLKIEYDKAEKELLVSFNDETTHLPSTSVFNYVPGTPKKRLEQITHPIVAGIASAQVETPMSHVHGGLGAGKKNTK